MSALLPKADTHALQQEFYQQLALGRFIRLSSAKFVEKFGTNPIVVVSLCWRADAVGSDYDGSSASSLRHAASSRSGYICAAELNNERPDRMADLKAAYGIGAAPGMNSDHCID